MPNFNPGLAAKWLVMFAGRHSRYNEKTFKDVTGGVIILSVQNTQAFVRIPPTLKSKSRLVVVQKTPKYFAT